MRDLTVHFALTLTTLSLSLSTDALRPIFRSLLHPLKTPSPISWPSVRHIFTFGDSYSSTSFNPYGTQPSPSNPLGTPAYPGDTKIGSPDWTSLLATEFSASSLLLYNFACGGATIEPRKAEEWGIELGSKWVSGGAASFRSQTERFFLPLYANGRIPRPPPPTQAGIGEG